MFLTQFDDAPVREQAPDETNSPRVLTESSYTKV